MWPATASMRDARGWPGLCGWCSWCSWFTWCSWHGRLYRSPSLLRWAATALTSLLILSSAPAHAARDAYTEGLAAYRAGQHAKAYKTLLPLAKKKDARAMYLVGVMYEGGRGVPRDDPTAAGWYEASVKQRYASAQYSLARMTIEGRGVDKSRDKGVALLQAAAAQGHREAAALLERLGVAVAEREPQPQAAVKPAAAAAGPAANAATSATSATSATPATSASAPTPASAASARTAAGAAAPAAAEVFTPLNRPAVQASHAALRSLLQRLAAADNAKLRRGLSLVAHDFAYQYWHIESIGESSLADAFATTAREYAGPLTALVADLASSRSPEAQAVSGLLIRLAGSPNPALLTGCPATILAAQGGFAFAWFQAARCITARDARQAGDWMLAAASAGHAGAQESAGRACLESDPKNWRCAKQWLTRSARSGRTSAMPVLGWALANQPDADDADQRSARDWYEKAADNGDLFAMNNLAALLERGPAPLRDPNRARHWYAQAARTGFGPAQFNLGRMLAEGIGGDANHDDAEQWLRKAAAAGVPEARAALEQMAR